ncbi:hypothetical protein ABZZ80_16220 [Streptomyces sp. NPDC006356]
MIFVFMGLIGVFATGHEYRYGTIRAALTAFPRRIHLWAAKTLVVAAVVAVVGGLLAAESLAIGLLVGGPSAEEVFTGSPMGRVAAGYVVFLVVCALFGLALAGIARSIPAAIVLLITVPMIVEGLISLILGVEAFESIRSLSACLPFTAGERMMAVSSETPLDGGPAPLAPPRGRSGLHCLRRRPARPVGDPVQQAGRLLRLNAWCRRGLTAGRPFVAGHAGWPA